jgi:hypothetical protein
MGDALETVEALRETIYGLGGAFMISRETKAFAEETGLSGWGPYFRGRCGVLGDVDADVVSAAVGFFPPSVVRAAWEAGAGLPAADAARRYARAAQDFGRRKLAGLPSPDAERLAELLEAVAARGPVVAAPLFAGWRAMELPEDARARVIQLAHVLRELRGGLHIAAVLAEGLTPLEAIVVNTNSQLIPGGPGNAEYFGWPGPYPGPTGDLRARRDAAEALTSRLMAPAVTALPAEERDELVALVARAWEIVFRRA